MRSNWQFGTVMAIAVCPLLALSAEAGAQLSTDCFALTYGAWADVDPRWGPPTVPATVRVEGMGRGENRGPLQGFSSDTAWVRVATRYQPRFTTWRTIEPQSVLATFSTGFGRLELRFSEGNGRWTGTAQAIGDVVGNPRPIAPLTAIPIACPIPTVKGAI